MFVRKSAAAINLTTRRLNSATLFANSGRWHFFSLAISFIYFLGGPIGVTFAQVNLNSPKTTDQPKIDQLILKKDSLTADQEETNSAADPPTLLASTQDKEDDSPDADPRNSLMSGPMHEAFLEVHDADPKPNEIVNKKAPEPINEVPPEFKPDGENVQWIPGYWGWDFEKEDFVWVSGLWRDIPPDRKWIPGYWQQVDAGYRWVSGYWQNEAEEAIEYLPTPPASIDAGPSTPAPGEDYFYVPGNWVMRNSVYRWSPGYWQANVVDWVWVPSRYIWSPYGCIYRPGYWDRVIGRRGIVFAPIYYSTPYYRTIGYRYTPRFSINVGVGLLPHLFVNLRYGHYYYGDWYGTRFRRCGLYPWVDAHRYHRRYYDPLLAYYSCPSRRYNNRNPYAWARDHHRHLEVHNELRPGRNFAVNTKRTAVKGSVGGAGSSIGIRYTDFVRQSGRQAQLNAAKGSGSSPGYYREFRQLSRNDIQQETTRLQPIRNVQVARRSHESTSLGGRDVGNRGKSKSGRKRLDIETYALSGQKAAGGSTDPRREIEARRSTESRRANDPRRFADTGRGNGKPAVSGSRGSSNSRSRKGSPGIPSRQSRADTGSNRSLVNDAKRGPNRSTGSTTTRSDRKGKGSAGGFPASNNRPVLERPSKSSAAKGGTANGKTTGRPAKGAGKPSGSGKKNGRSATDSNNRPVTPRTGSGTTDSRVNGSKSSRGTSPRNDPAMDPRIRNSRSQGLPPANSSKSGPSRARSTGSKPPGGSSKGSSRNTLPRGKSSVGSTGRNILDGSSLGGSSLGGSPSDRSRVGDRSPQTGARSNGSGVKGSRLPGSSPGRTSSAPAVDSIRQQRQAQAQRAIQNAQRAREERLKSIQAESQRRQAELAKNRQAEQARRKLLETQIRQRQDSARRAAADRIQQDARRRAEAARQLAERNRSRTQKSSSQSSSSSFSRPKPQPQPSRSTTTRPSSSSRSTIRSNSNRSTISRSSTSRSTQSRSTMNRSSGTRSNSARSSAARGNRGGSAGRGNRGRK